MENINYEKILKHLIEDCPHELDKIEKVIKDSEGTEYSANIEFSEIIKSNIWNSDEKARLLTFLGYSKYEHGMDYIDEHGNKEKMKDYLYTINYDILSGFEALMKTYKDIPHHFDDDGRYITKDAVYRRIFDAVISNCKDENKALYIKVILNSLTIEDVKRLIMPYYVTHFLSDTRNVSIFINIIASKDLDLIKKYMCYIDDINMYLSEAVATGDIEIVKLFLEKGADVNYLTDEVVLGRLTPLKTAITNNDYEMVKFLIDNGADVNLQIRDDDFINRLKNYQIDIFNDYFSWGVINEENKDVKQLKYIRESSPLEYATKLRMEEYNYYSLSPYTYTVYFNGFYPRIKNEIFVNTNNISEQVINRRKIVDLIYDKLDNKTNINYSDLIGFTFTTKDIERFKKYGKYAIDNNCQIDFDLLFELYFKFHIQNDREMLILFMDFIAKYDNDSEIYLRFFNYYLKRIMHNNSFYSDDFSNELLNKISKEKEQI